MITYDDKEGTSSVHLDGKRIGTITRAADNTWSYIPKAGLKYRGKSFKSRAVVKQTLEN